MKIVGGKWSNWSGGVTCKPKTIVAPKGELEIAATVRTAPETVRAPGTGHSFTPVSACDGTLLDMSAFNGLHGFDHDRMVATLGAGTPLWEVGPLLYDVGVGLKNMGDIDRQTLGGVVGTGTHGTGRTLGSFSAECAGFTLIEASGEVVDCSPTENTEVWEAGRCSLGTFGVMTEISMNVRPAYKLVERNFLLDSKEGFSKLDQFIADNRHFEFFWFPYSERLVCKTLNETGRDAPAPRSAEAMYARGEKGGGEQNLFSGINEVLPYASFLLGPAHRLFSGQMPGPERVRWSHEAFPSPRTTRFNEMEYAVPVEKGPDCIREVVEMIRKRRINTGFPIEYRTVAADDVWLSPFYKRESATIAVHQYHRVDTTRLFEACEAIFRAYNGRPHWGKRHTRTAAELPSIYPEFDRFVALRRRLDPKCKFLNNHLAAMFQ
ncbi:MAG TPA: D-arabinono-1,4-lactone oxidase [Rhizomicrobium sp.]|jgi:FAD-linked oxidoreductase